MTARAGPSRRAFAGLVAAVAVAAALVVGMVLATRTPEQEAPAGQLDDDRVVATLRTGDTEISDPLRAALRAARADQGNAAAAKEAARRLIAEGRAAGDSRLVGAALGVLRPFLETPDAEILYLAANARQYQHDFTGAIDLLGRAAALAPRDANVLLTRATIHTVLGRFDAADADCRRLHALPRPDLGFLCQSAALLLTEQAPAVYERLEAIAAQPQLLDPGLRSYATGLMGEIAALQGWWGLARAHLAQELAEDPEALRTRMMLADVLLQDDAAGEALRVLEGAPEVDGVLVRRAIAAGRLQKPAIADPARAELAQRFRQNLDLGLSAHAREETRFYLEVEPDFELALERALVNWDLQREIEDAQLLVDAAVAAGVPQAAAPVLRWMSEQGVSVPTLRIPDAVREAAR